MSEDMRDRIPGSESQTTRKNDLTDEGQKGSSEVTDLLRFVVGLLGRAVFSEDRLRELVSPTGNASYFDAYRMCDGRTSPSAILKQTGIDQSSLSKTIAKWAEAGIISRIGPRRLPLHVYPVTNPAEKSASKRSRSEKQPAAAPVEGADLFGRDLTEGL
jgi:hypothetical protein